MTTRTLPAGVYHLPAGRFRVVACIGRGKGRRMEKRFPPGTADRTMTRWQEDARRELRDRPTPQDGTLAGDVLTYLEARASMRTYKDRTRHLKMWTAALGASRARDTVKAPEVRAVLERWRTNGWAGPTCNRAKAALQSFYTVLNGKSGTNPVRDVPNYPEPQALPKAISYALVERILRVMPDHGYGAAGGHRGPVSLSKARLRVMAYTGLPPEQIKQLTRAHLRTEGTWPDGSPCRLLYVPGRRKGTGTDDVLLPLADRAHDALVAFFACGADGPYANQVARRAFQSAAKKCGRPDLTPYDLRHLFGTTVLRSSKNRAATRDLMLHTNDRMTRRYTRAAIPIELWSAVRAFEAAVDAEVVASGCGDGATEAGGASVSITVETTSGRASAR